MENESTQKESNSPGYHTPVLFTESLEALNIRPEGIYVDCTFGGGGHSKGILERLGAEGKLIAFDQDADAQRNIPADERLVFVPQNFRHLSRFLRLHGISHVNGLLADLGVSSHQFDEGSRGFSTRFDGPVDMRMDQRQSVTAKDVLLNHTEQQLHRLFEQYGEVSNSKTLAKYIVQNRNPALLQSISSLKTFLAPVVKGNPNKYFAQVFQALRIEVNEEMAALKEMLQQIPEILAPGGRVAIITFHSIEDRLVKNFFRNETFEEEPDLNPFVSVEKIKKIRVITKKPVEPAAEEVKRNPRSRSAKLRVAERC